MILVFFLTTPAFAHYLWVSAQDGYYVVNRGMLEDPPHPYDPACIKEVKAYAGDGTTLTIKTITEPEQTSFKTDRPAAMATVVSDWGYRVDTTAGKKIMTREQAENKGLNVISAFFSRQFSKTIFVFSDRQLRPAGLLFEIIPLADPTTAAPGSSIPFRLLYEGLPLGEITIYTHDGRKIDTDKKGEFQLPVKQAGLHSVYARHKVPVDKNTEMDYLQLMTFITFTTK